jgi:hypothetical protein
LRRRGRFENERDRRDRCSDVKETSILVLSPDELLTALLSALVETQGYRPLFAHRDEPPRAALGRLRPRIVLLDAELPDACEPAFLGPAQMLGTSVLLFARKEFANEIAATAAKHHLASFTIPVHADELAALLPTLLLAR